MMKFRDEQGNIVTPREDDYVMASDIKDKEMHNQVREAFCMFCSLEEHMGQYGASNQYCYRCNEGGVFCSEYIVDVKPHGRRIIPTQQTLFEAAKDAPDGTRFLIGPNKLRAIKRMRSGPEMVWEVDGEDLPYFVLISTDFEIVPPGPRKRDVGVCTLTSTNCVTVPDDLENQCIEAFKLIGRLAMWEGAQIGDPGFVYRPGQNGMVLMTKPNPIEVTFHTKEQCEASWRGECPEMFTK